MPSDIVNAIGTIASQPASGSFTLDSAQVEYPYFHLTFTLDRARMTVTDAGASGSYGALKLFDFNQGAISFHGCRQNYTAFAEGSALTGGAGDAAFKIGVGTVAKAAAADGALAGANDDDIGGEISVTLSGGTATATLTSTTAVYDGTSTAADVVVNWSGTAATIDATSTLDITATITVAGVFLGDD